MLKINIRYNFFRAKTLFFAILVPALLAGFFVTADKVVAQSGPLYIWHFNECSGSQAQSLASSSAMSIANNKWSPGKWNCGLEQYYNFGKTQASLDDISSGEVTVSFYYKMNKNSRLVINLKNSTSGQSLGIRSSGYDTVIWGLPGTITKLFPSDGLWHQAFLVVDSASGTWKIYLDGEEFHIYQGQPFSIPSIDLFENWGDSDTNYIDEIAIWDKALANQEIVEIYDSQAEIEPRAPQIPEEEKKFLHLWNFNENEGNEANDLVGQTTLYNIPRFVAGKFGSALKQKYHGKDGTINSTLDEVINSKNISFSYWFKNEAPNESRCAVKLQGDNGSLGITPSIRRTYIYGEDNLVTLTPPSAIPNDSDWHYFSLVFDSSAFEMRFYIDGQEIYSGEAVPLVSGFDKLQMITENYPCNIDDLSIWQGALSQQEIQDYYNSGKSHQEYYLEEKRNPVIIVPGIIASKLNNIDTSDEIWPDIVSMGASFSDDYLDDLMLPDNGVPESFNIEPVDILREIDIPLIIYKDYFQGLLDELEDNGYEEGVDLFVFPYDWRLNIDYLSGRGAGDDPNTLANKIYEVKNITGAEKVDIIAHSMGGILVKTYMKNFSTSSIDIFIDIATPHHGSVDAAKILNYGDNIRIPVLNHLKIQDISQNMPSIYQLLPSQAYFDPNNQDYNSYIADIYDIDGNSITGNLSYQESLNFLVNQGRNAQLIIKNNELHSRIDGFEFANSYNIVGLGEPTIGKIYTLNEKGDGTFEYALKQINGDGTVPLRSAEAFSDNIIYVSDATHPYIPSTDGVPELVVSILNNDIDNFDYSVHKNISLDKEDFQFSGRSVSYHCPIDLHIYDPEGNHVGPDENGNIEMNIPGVKYDIIGDNSFAFLPDGREYIVKGEAREPGLFNARIETIENSQYVEKVYFSDLSMDSTSTEVEFDIIDNQEEYIINIDQDGDGTLDQEIEPSSILKGEEMSDFAKPETTISISGTEGNDNYYISTTTIAFTAIDPIISRPSSGILHTKYSLDNGETWHIYENPIILEDSGTSTIIYYSVDRAGNKEIPKTEIVKIDKELPIIDIIYPVVDVPVFHSDVLNIEYGIIDNYSGVSIDTTEIYFDNEILNTRTIDLFHKSLGEHTIKIIAQDKAGNEGQIEVIIRVITDLSSLKQDINRSHQEELINDKAYNKLKKEVENIEKINEKRQKHLAKRTQKQKQILDKCLNKNGQEFCENKIGTTFDRINQKIDIITEKIINIKYKLLLKKLNIYFKLGWITEEGNDILKEEINYLISKLK